MASHEATPRPATRRTRGPAHQLPPPGDGDEELGRTGLGQLLRDLADDTRTLVQQEIELAKMEAAATARRMAKDGAWIGVGAAIAGVGGLCVVIAAALGLGALLDSYWLGTLITGLVLLLVGGIFAWRGLGDLKKGGLIPSATVESLQEDRDWAQREVEELKHGLSEEHR